MGRVKLKIEKLDRSPNCLATYSKRKNGIVKKAQEMSVLCDIDIAVLMFSPTEKPFLWKADNSTMEGIVRRLAELTPHERVKRKLEIFMTLRRAYRNSDHEMIVPNNLCSSHQSVGDLMKLASSLRTQLSEIQQRLSDWTGLDKVDSRDFLGQMEAFIGKLLAQIRKRKENIEKQQLSAQGCHFESQDQVQIPMSLDDEQQARHCSWIENDRSQPMASPEEMLLLSKRTKEFSAGNSFANYTDYLGIDGIPTRQENDISTEFLRTELLRNELIGLKTETLRDQLTKTQNLKNELPKREPLKVELHYPEFLSDEVNKNGSLILELSKLNSMRNELIEATTLANVFSKPRSLEDELMKTESLRNQLINTSSTRNTSSMRNELHEPESLRLQLCEQDSYPLYNFETHPNQDRETVQQMNLQQSIDTPNNRFEPVRQQTNLQHGVNPRDNRCEQVRHMILERSIEDFSREGNFELPLGYYSNQCNWASTSRTFVADAFDEHLYTQQHCLVDDPTAKEQHYSIDVCVDKEH